MTCRQASAFGMGVCYAEGGIVKADIGVTCAGPTNAFRDAMTMITAYGVRRSLTAFVAALRHIGNYHGLMRGIERAIARNPYMS